VQLKPDDKAIRRRLIAASCALLGASAARSPVAHADTAGNTGSNAGGVVIDSALAYYQEGGGLISAIEPVVHLRMDNGDGMLFNLNFAYDSLSGSSPNGALKSDKPQTFASPSGTSLTATSQTYTTASGREEESSSPVYTIAAGQLPVDPNFRDQRYALGGSWQLPLSRLTSLTLGGNVSSEHDFLSLSVNAGIAHDFNQKNTTLSLGVNDESDKLSPIGGAPVPASDYALFRKQGNQSKNGVGAQLGLTQVMSRRWVSELSLSADRFNGYLNDPYKIVSVIDAAGNTTGYLYEKRPESRLRKSVYLENRYAWDHASAAFSLRHMSDDWHVKSDTAQLRVRWWNAPHDRYLEPTVRWYQQGAADFYTPWLDSTGGQYGGNASADARLGAFHAFTYGLKYGLQGQDDNEFSVRLEYYQQHADHKLTGPGSLQGLDLYPSLSAVLLQVGYRFNY
jgi:hypothetical protein